MSAVDELKSRVDELTDRVGAQGKGAKKSDLTLLRTELSERLEALDLRVEAVATEVTEGQKSTVGKLEKAIASLRKDVDVRAADVDQRLVEALGSAAELRDQLERLREAADANDTERKTAEADLVRRIEESAARLEEGLAMPGAEYAPALDEARSEIVSLAERLDRSDATTAEALAKLTTDLEAVAQSSLDLVGHVERAGTGDTSELDARLQGLERRLAADGARADEQVRATEEALREGLAALGSRLAETESSYLEAGSALRRSIERLGAAIVEADNFVAGSALAAVPPAAVSPADEPQTGPYLAFVPHGTGYGLRELDGPVPAIGASVSVPDGDDELVVSRVGRSPLPLDRRRCVYLERGSDTSSLDRVP